MLSLRLLPLFWTLAAAALPARLVAQSHGELGGGNPASGAAVDDSLRGQSGKLLARLVGGRRDGPLRILQALFGENAARRPGIYRAAEGARPFALITMLPFQAKVAGRIGSYRVGSWPRERAGNADLPDGFIEVTRENQDTRVSQHFMLRDFLTHDQQNVWPKYLVLRETLVDKLELVIADLQQRGVRVNRMAVLSGFRTPQYNAPGVRPGGRASDSRHQYGDAADVFVDNDGNGLMDDLNRDGVVNSLDSRIILESVDRVEARHPALSGGASLYRGNHNHAGFVHVDVRGSRVRWGTS